jgi:hypothetical protein
VNRPLIRLSTVLVIIGTSLSLAACAEDPVDDSVVLAEMDRASWSLPLDPYQRPLVDVIASAQDVFIQDCMRSSGIRWEVAPTEREAAVGESWNLVGRKLFSVELASEYGYGNSSQIARSVAVQRASSEAESANRSLPESAHAVFDQCLADSREMTNEAAGRDSYELAEQLAGVAYGDAKADDDVEEAASRWRGCLTEAGVPDLPRSPDQMPPDSIAGLRASNVDGGDASGEDELVPAEEIRVAVADAACRESVGYASALYEAEWRAQSEALAARADDLSRYKQQIDGERARAEAYLTDHTADAR